MLTDKPVFKDSPAYIQLSELIGDGSNIIVGHNARFAISMLEREGIHPPHYICTLKLARYLDPRGIIPQYTFSTFVTIWI
jgi:DNA polymerase III epsilon subunit-like protein